MMVTDTYLQTIRQWADQGYIRPLDYQFTVVLSEYKPDSPELLYLAALTSYQLASGNVCLPLSFFAEPDKHWPELIVQSLKEAGLSGLQSGQLVIDQVVLGDGQVPCPLIMDEERIYLYRYWQYETYVATELQRRGNPQTINEPLLTQGLQRLFPQSPESLPDWQKVAAAISVQKSFSVISGGPGTGKTTTVIKLLALYVEQCLQQDKIPLIRLVAPTGKASARLSESISGAKEKINFEAGVAELIPTEACTLHRLLGVIPDRVSFRHNSDNPLHLDLLVVDEASMIDLPMMARLLQALPSNARVVLLGDHDQLASVEAGSVLADICSWPGELKYSAQQNESLQRLCQIESSIIPSYTPQSQAYQNEVPQRGAGHGFTDSFTDGLTDNFTDCLALLRKSYRFSSSSGIGQLSRAVNCADEQQIQHLIKESSDDLLFHGLDNSSYQEMLDQVLGFYAGIIRQAKEGQSSEVLLKEMSKQQLLCALRSGVYGIEGVNEAVRTSLVSKGFIRGDSSWFIGRPVMIVRNDVSTGLYNGDIGITLADAEGRLKVWFEQNGELRGFLPSRLPEHESVFAMTVHKSQGSEFTTVALLLPPEDHPLLTRELVYTAVTRAREKLHLYCRETLIVSASKRVTERAGGLSLRLWQET